MGIKDEYVKLDVMSKEWGLAGKKYEANAGSPIVVALPPAPASTPLDYIGSLDPTPYSKNTEDLYTEINTLSGITEKSLIEKIKKNKKPRQALKSNIDERNSSKGILQSKKLDLRSSSLHYLAWMLVVATLMAIIYHKISNK